VTKSERAELFSILIDLQIRIAKISGTADYLADVLQASGGAEVDLGGLVALRTRQSYLEETAERLQGRLWTLLPEDQSAKKPTQDRGALSH
jgi:hypothetical protein